jgi:hypothetical protein
VFTSLLIRSGGEIQRYFQGGDSGDDPGPDSPDGGPTAPGV